MVSRALLSALRARTLAEQVLEPAIWTARTPLSAAVARGEACAEAARGEAGADPAGVLRSGRFEPVEPGWRWGPVWSTVWFRLRGELPPGAAREGWRLRFSSGTEALLWCAAEDGVAEPWHGFDENHRDALLPGGGALQAGRVELLLEASCNRPLGATTFFFDEAETRARWDEPAPGRFELAELARRDDTAFELCETVLFVADLVEELGDDSLRGKSLQRALECCYTAAEAGRLHEALAGLRGHLGGGASPSASRCFAVGHAHLDTAWLWSTRETRRKALRTFSSALALLEARDEFHFLCTQPQQYAWVAEDSPALFERIGQAVTEDRFEPLGATWIEPDANLPAGESLCRQFELGLAAMRDWFGERGAQRMLYLPDTFGFCATLPQLAALAGLDTFVTNKLWWSEVSSFPHVTFRWRGLDGTEILSHLTPGQDYNATQRPQELRRGERLLAERDESGCDVWLQPYGFGDGGGGPTEAQVLRGELAAGAEGLPRVEAGGARAFCAALHERVAELTAAGTSLPVHDGELYLELHRGTWTSQAELKRRNAVGERRLIAAEARAAGDAFEASRAEAFERCWRDLLLNQFHDILPGSGTRAVTVEALEVYDRVDAELDALGLDGDAPPDSESTPCAREGERFVLANGHLRAEFSAAGLLVSLRGIDSTTAEPGPELIDPAAGACALQLHADRPRRWEAWDLDAESLQQFERLAAATVEAEGAGLRVGYELEGGSEIELRFSLAPDGRRLDLALDCRWRERRRWLRLMVPTAIRSRSRTGSIPFGHLERPTTRNDAAERARFEVPLQRWMDLSQPGRGLALLNSAKYAGAVEDRTMALSLLRGPCFPDESADDYGNAPHRIELALVPHAGDWRAAGLLDELERFVGARPMTAVLAGSSSSGPCRAQVSALRWARDGSHRILRLFESHGAEGEVELHWRDAPRAVRAVDLTGAPDERIAPVTEGSVTRMRLGAFQVATLRVEHDA